MAQHDRRPSYREQLKAVTPFLLLKTTGPSTASAWKKDGEDHINISRHAQTDLGYRLDFDHPRGFDHPMLGSFRSLNSLFYFLRAKEPNDYIRNVIRGELREFVFDHCGGVYPTFPNYKAVMMHSAYIRIKSLTGYMKTLIDSTLPFDHYRELASGIRERNETTPWLVAGYEEIRKALKENREPDFSVLMVKREPAMYTSVIKRLNPNYDPAAVKEDRQRHDNEDRPRQDRKEKPKAKPQQAPKPKTEGVEGTTPAVADTADASQKNRRPRQTKAEKHAAWEEREARRLAKAAEAQSQPIVNAAPEVTTGTQDHASAPYAPGEQPYIIAVDEAAPVADISVNGAGSVIELNSVEEINTMFEELDPSAQTAGITPEAEQELALQVKDDIVSNLMSSLGTTTRLDPTTLVLRQQGEQPEVVTIS